MRIDVPSGKRTNDVHLEHRQHPRRPSTNASVDRLTTQVSSGSTAVTIGYHLPTVTIGERINPLGKRLRASEFLENGMKRTYPRL